MQLKGLFSSQKKNDLFVEEYILCSLFHYRFPEILQIANVSQRFLSSKKYLFQVRNASQLAHKS